MMRFFVAAYRDRVEVSDTRDDAINSFVGLKKQKTPGHFNSWCLYKTKWKERFFIFYQQGENQFQSL